jgi:coenzyme F420-reducing hydrogenase delta subunit
MQVEFKPLIVSFCCNWCSYAGADMAGTSRFTYPAQVRIIRVPCSCRVDISFVLRAFARGADGVIVCGCHLGDCHYATGNHHTKQRMEDLFGLLSFMGMEGDRLRLEWISAAEGAKFADVMNDFVTRIEKLGKNQRYAGGKP